MCLICTLNLKTAINIFVSVKNFWSTIILYKFISKLHGFQQKKLRWTFCYAAIAYTRPLKKAVMSIQAEPCTSHVPSSFEGIAHLDAYFMEVWCLLLSSVYRPIPSLLLPTLLKCYSYRLPYHHDNCTCTSLSIINDSFTSLTLWWLM